MNVLLDILILFLPSNTAGFKGYIQSVTLISNGIRYVVGTIESVQLLHYANMALPETTAATSMLIEDPEFLPYHHGELVLHTKAVEGNDESDIRQLILKCRLPRFTPRSRLQLTGTSR